MKVALLAPIAWRTPPRHYGPWETIVSLLAEGLIKQGIEVTLFATLDSITEAKLDGICPVPYEENREMDPKVWECLHIAHLFEQADAFDIIHNHYDFLPLSYSRLVKTPVVTTIHGFSNPQILPVYRNYNKNSHYVSISDSDRSPDLQYIATVYHGINLNQFTFSAESGDYLLFFGRIHPDKGAHDAIQIARRVGMKLILAGIIQDQNYYCSEIAPFLDEQRITYIGSVGPQQRDRLLQGAYALLHPIYFEEPFGLSVVEAMACGTPVVAFNKGSMAEIIDDWQTGFLVDNVDQAVERIGLVENIERQKCRTWVEAKFSQERMVADYIEVYDTILKML